MLELRCESGQFLSFAEQGRGFVLRIRVALAKSIAWFHEFSHFAHMEPRKVWRGRGGQAIGLLQVFIQRAKLLSERKKSVKINETEKMPWGAVLRSLAGLSLNAGVAVFPVDGLESGRGFAARRPARLRGQLFNLRPAS